MRECSLIGRRSYFGALKVKTWEIYNKKALEKLEIAGNVFVIQPTVGTGGY